MTAAGRICAVCQRPVFGDAIRVIRDSASGARPDMWVHPECDRDPLRPLKPRPRRAR